jgi:competence protein ComEA
MSPAPLPPTSPPAWPRSAQWATAFLLGVATTLLGVYALSSLRGGTRPTELSSRIDLNRAGQAELLQLPGVGPHLAQRIKDYRDAHGGFRDVDELTGVEGVGPATLERLRPWVEVRDEDIGEESERPVRAVLPKGKPSAKAPAKAEKLAGRVNVNQATAEELQALPGIGSKMAQHILEEREKRPFQSVDDLRRVPGIGPKRLEQLRPYVTAGKDAGRVAKAD